MILALIINSSAIRHWKTDTYTTHGIEVQNRELLCIHSDYVTFELGIVHLGDKRTLFGLFRQVYLGNTVGWKQFSWRRVS